MALLASCLCCSLLLGSIMAGVYTTVVYLVAFVVSLWWIVEAEAGLVESPGKEGRPPIPIPAYLLCLGYLLVAATSAWMLFSLYKKRERALLVWVFVMTLFCFPEMGMVTFMAFVHWKISTAYGVADLIFYVFRAAFNLLSVLCIQSQYSSWRDEMVSSQTLKRLEHLRVGCVSTGEVSCSESTTAYQNPAFVPTQEGPPSPFNRLYSQASENGGLAAGAGSLPPTSMSSWDPYLARDSQSEFNAAIFSPASMGFLPLVSGVSQSEAVLPMVPAAGVYHHTPQLLYTPHYYSTQSLDRRRYVRRVPEVGMADGLSLEAGLLAGQGLSLFTLPGESRSSLAADSDDLRRYRDVAL